MTQHPTPRWADPKAAWWAKVRRVAVHITDVKASLAEYERRNPWNIDTRPGPDANQTTYVLRVHAQVPSDLITKIGDAVHNLRTALDAVAYELGRGHVAGTLTEKQEQATEFPLCKDQQDFDKWCEARGRADLYGDAERNALRCVQPFAIDDEARVLGIDVPIDPATTLRTDGLYRLHRISVIDKHRRLPIVSLVPDLTYWPGPENGDTYQWQPLRATAYEDGTDLGVFTNATGTTPPLVGAVIDMRLNFSDDPGYGQSITVSLDGWLRTISGWVLPRMMVTAEGDKPPFAFWN